MYNRTIGREMRNFLLLILLMFLLISCQSSEMAADHVTPSPPIITKSAAGELPESSETEEPSKTPSPTVISHTSTPTPDANFLELPAWVKNPSSQIVLFVYDTPSTRPSEIGFFNAANGEQAIIKLPFEIYQYYWKDANHIVFLEGYCNEPVVQVTELDISKGILSPSTVENLPKRIAYCYGLEDKTEIKIDATLPEPTVVGLDSSSDTWFRITDPNDGVSDIRFELSPNGDYLGVVQVQGNYDFPELWQPLFGTQVSVYHLPDRKLVASFAEEQEVSTMLLFTDNENLVYVRESTPCIISIAEKTKKCIHAISDRLTNSIIILGDPLKDRQKLSFLYFGNASPYSSGWCIYDLFSGELNCPTDGFEDLQGQTILSFALSPDNNYLLFIYDYKGCPPPWCDFAGDPQIAVIDIAEKKFFHLGSAQTYQALSVFGDSQPWRPSP